MKKNNKTKEIDFRALWTVKIGTGLKTPADFYKALADAHCEINHVDEIIDDVIASEIETEVDIVSIDGFALGIKDYYTNHNEVRMRAKKLGLQLVTPEVLIQFRLQYDNESIRKGDFLFTVAIERILSSRGTLLAGVFVNGGGDDGVKRFMAIDIEDSSSAKKNCDRMCRWVFIKPRN